MKSIYAFSKVAFLSVLSFSLLLSGCRKEEDIIPDPSSDTNFSAERYPSQVTDSYIVKPWYDLLTKLIRETPGHVPPVAARDIGYTGIALYEAVTGGLQNHRSMAGQLSGLSSLPQRSNGKAYIPEVCANAALAGILKQLFANASTANIASIDSMESANELYYGSLYGVIHVQRSVDFGHSIADAIFSWSMTDGGHLAYTNVFPPSYTPPTGADKWVPTPPLFQPALLPHWGDNRTFAPVNATSVVDPPGYIAFSTDPASSFYAAAQSVYSTVNNLTQAQRDIALYWADGGGSFTPPGHSIAIAVQVVRSEKLSLSEASILLAKTGMALNDAGIVCWRSKFDHNLLRPITYIRNYIDTGWSSLIPTPPFPSYTSGHSSFSGSTAFILTKKFGANFSFTDSTKIASGFSPRSFSSFNQAAQEAAVSRLYGGIHYSFDNDNGFTCGQLIAEKIEQLKW